MEPLDEAHIKAALHLAVTPGFGPVCFNVMRDAGFTTPLQIMEAPAGALPVLDGRLKRGGEALALSRQRYAAKDDRPIARSLALLRRGARLWVRGTGAYPKRLLDLEDAPGVLMVAGKKVEEALEKPCVAVVGARESKPYGQDMARLIATGLAAAGVTVVSGAAEGIDSIAHDAAMAAGGLSVAVLGVALGSTHALDVAPRNAVTVQPPAEENTLVPPDPNRVRAQLREHGGLVTEMFPELDQHSGSFTVRNRIISGLCQGVVIVEGEHGSGTTYTANYARNQGRLLMAVPGCAADPGSCVPLAVLRDGGKAVFHADDVLVEIGLKPRPEAYVELKRPPPKVRPQVYARSMVDLDSLTPAQRRLWETLRAAGEAMLVDDVASQAGLSPAVASTALLELEMKGVCQRAPGGAYALA